MSDPILPENDGKSGTGDHDKKYDFGKDAWKFNLNMWSQARLVAYRGKYRDGLVGQGDTDESATKRPAHQPKDYEPQQQLALPGPSDEAKVKPKPPRSRVIKKTDHQGEVPPEQAAEPDPGDPNYADYQG